MLVAGEDAGLAIETVEAIVEIIDAELIKDNEYESMGKKPADRVKALLGNLDSMRRSKERGYNVNEELIQTLYIEITKRINFC